MDKQEYKEKMDELENVSVKALAQILKMLEAPEIIPKDAFKKEPDEDTLTEEEKKERHRNKEADCIVAILRHLYETKTPSYY